ncbi:MAG: thioredoxin [Defluviitaleaceae bacterium]|nr:thioredoxin [Defluviitaleaceae bacterium]
MSAKLVTKEQFQDILANENRTVLVDFYASWCTPCKIIAPVLDQIAEERQDIVVCKISVEEHPDVASQYGVRSIPTLVSFKGGDVYKRITGSVPKASILEIVD